MRQQQRRGTTGRLAAVRADCVRRRSADPGRRCRRPSDRTTPGFFNYTDYENSELRMLRLELTAALRAGRHVSLLGEVRSQNAGMPQAYALYLRIRPWTERRFDVQVGRIPPTFGAFPRRSYEAENPLIGYPLAYQYLTSLRADAIPGSADELLDMRGRGWLASYSVGNSAEAPRVPLRQRAPMGHRGAGPRRQRLRRSHRDRLRRARSRTRCSPTTTPAAR